jgi:hypothetical protein
MDLPVLVYACVSLLAGFAAFQFPETLDHPLPQTVADVERMCTNK